MSKRFGNFSKAEMIVGTMILILMVTGAWGWVENIWKLVHSSFYPMTVLMVLRFIGIFLLPVGGILGYIGN